jgi:hypothetical protein
MWRRVVFVWTDVSEDRIAYIFKVEKTASEESVWASSCILQLDLLHADLQNVTERVNGFELKTNWVCRFWHFN